MLVYLFLSLTILKLASGQCNGEVQLTANASGSNICFMLTKKEPSRLQLLDKDMQQMLGVHGLLFLLLQFLSFLLLSDSSILQVGCRSSFTYFIEGAGVIVSVNGTDVGSYDNTTLPPAIITATPGSTVKIEFWTATGNNATATGSIH